MPTDPKRVQAVFLAAASAADRTAVLDRECDGDPDLRRRVEALLAAHDDPGSFLDRPDATAAVSSPDTSDHRPRDDRPGAVLAGKYKLVEPIGEGGMGSVWMAQQIEPVKRVVAIKLIKEGMDTRQVLARFEAERQALALMDHPNIAKVLDAGATPDGRPFFVMELVKGVPITKFCDERKLTPRERLELFVPVCQAIQHAHQKGVIHRDIKPSNVLVALYDDRPVPKIIDFGVAKAAGQTLTEKTLMTGFGAVVGTPEYMSPEQATLNQLDIDTRSDVYSLGVLLYELLAGSPPFRWRELQQAGLLEMLRVIRESEPPRLSTKLSTADALPSLAASRGTEPRRLAALLRGELDWIVMKALEKERSRRYETANGFAADVQRYLAGEPVQAVPPSTSYRLRKFVRRNRGAVAAWCAIMVAVLAGAAAATWGLVRAQRAAAETQRSAVRVRAVNDFLLKDLLGQADPEINPDGAKLTVRQALDRAAVRLEGSPAIREQPGLEPELRSILGNAYRSLDALLESERQLRRAVEVSQTLMGEHDDRTLDIQSDLGRTLTLLERYEEAEEVLRRALAARVAVSGPEHEKTLTVEDHLAQVLFETGRGPEALAMIRRVAAATRNRLGPDHGDTILAECNLAYLLAERRDPAEAQEAEEIFRRRLPDAGRVFGPDSPHTQQLAVNFTRLLYHRGLHEEAARVGRDTLERRQRLYGEDHLATRIARNDLALYLLELGQIAEAEREFRALYTADKAAADNPHRVRVSAGNLGLALHRLGRLDEAEQFMREALDITARLGVEAQPGSIQSLVNLAQLLADRGKLDDAAAAYRRVLELDRIALGPGDPDPRILAPLGEVLLRQRRFAEAEVVLGDNLKLRERTNPDGWGTFLARLLLGDALLGQTKYASAESMLVAGYTGMRERAAEIPTAYQGVLHKAADRLVELYAAWGKPDEAAKWRAERAKYRERAPRPRAAK